ncbi:MAG: Coenzyme F420 hydrogenase/dehydrogenase, beta subunit C-terminal domain [Desulfosalsimonas sp.]
MNERQNISPVASARLCNTCGACFGVCPTEAIHYQETLGGYYLPEVDEGTCIECGLCLEVCPGVHFGETLKSSLPKNPFAGCALKTCVGKATDKKLFENSQSGGIVSALLVHALKTGRISGAVTVTMQPGSPPRPVARIAKTAQEIQQAQKSKYCPVPVLGFLRELKDHDGPVAVVGTSCQVHGLKNVLDKKPRLQNKIAFCIGLVCDRVLTYSALDYLLNKAKLSNSQNPSILHFRDKAASGYPGDVHVFSYNDNPVVMPAKTRMQVKDYFTPARCRLCFDKMNVFSDITVGDPHGLEGVDRKMGESMLVARTDPGLEIIHAAKNEGAINIRPTEYEQVLKGQGIEKKKEQWQGYSLAWAESGHDLPGFYDQVVEHVGANPDRSKYKKDLEYSLSLDNFASRQVLIRYVDKAVQKKQAVQTLFSPLRLAKRVARKILK